MHVRPTKSTLLITSEKLNYKKWLAYRDAYYSMLYNECHTTTPFPILIVHVRNINMYANVLMYGKLLKPFASLNLMNFISNFSSWLFIDSIRSAYLLLPNPLLTFKLTYRIYLHRSSIVIFCFSTLYDIFYWFNWQKKISHNFVFFFFWFLLGEQKSQNGK